MVPTAIKHIYQTPHNQQTVSKGVREKQCLLPWNTSTKQSANSQQGTVGKQSAGTVTFDQFLENLHENATIQHM